MIVQLRLRRGTTAEWTAANPVLADGEPALDTDANVLKIGDGTSAWSALPIYANNPALFTTAVATSTAAAASAAASAAAAAAAGTATSTRIGDATDVVNVTGKVVGRVVFNSTTSKPLWAVGTGPTSPWVDATGATVITPA